MALYKVVVESDGEQREFEREYSDWIEAATCEHTAISMANADCQFANIPGGRLVSITEVDNDTAN